MGRPILHRPSTFEKHSGKGAVKDWKQSIRVVGRDGKVGQTMGEWLMEHQDDEENSSGDSLLGDDDLELAAEKTKDDELEELVGTRVEVYWPLDRAYYRGTVKNYNPRKRKHSIVYDDGDKEYLDMSKQRWRKVEDEDEEEPADTKKAKTSSQPEAAATGQEYEHSHPSTEPSEKEEVVRKRGRGRQTGNEAVSRGPQQEGTAGGPKEVAPSKGKAGANTANTSSTVTPCRLEVEANGTAGQFNLLELMDNLDYMYQMIVPEGCSEDVLKAVFGNKYSVLLSILMKLHNKEGKTKIDVHDGGEIVFDVEVEGETDYSQWHRKLGRAVSQALGWLKLAGTSGLIEKQLAIALKVAGHKPFVEAAQLVMQGASCITRHGGKMCLFIDDRACEEIIRALEGA